jgi:hypothetical protein
VFPIKRAMDPDGEGIVDEKDVGRFLKARAGDHFMCQFQCDLCHFRNIQRRNPVVGNIKDSLSLRCIWRATWMPCGLGSPQKFVET